MNIRLDHWAGIHFVKTIDIHSYGVSDITLPTGKLSTSTALELLTQVETFHSFEVNDLLTSTALNNLWTSTTLELMTY